MKKLLAIFFILSVCNFANAQISVYSTTLPHLQITTEPNIDAIFMFNGINLSTEIVCNFTNTDGGTRHIEWRKYNGINVEEEIWSNTPFISLSFQPNDASGYILYIDNEPTYWVWVIDYSLYPVNISNLRVEPLEQNFCQNLILVADINTLPLFYKDKNGMDRTLMRSFTLDYVDYAFIGENWQNNEISISVNPLTQIKISAPKQDVTFTLSGDNFAKQMNIENLISVAYLDYRAVAVENHLKGTVKKRSVPPTDKPNEEKQDISNGNKVEGSAPLEVDFVSRANKPVAAFFEWVIYNEKTPSSYRRYPNEDIRYTFPEHGIYIVKLTVTSAGGCMFVDSLTVETIESFLAVPNFFTPNGDGTNDEFRVAYSSIKTYKCVVFNRWGSVVFTSTNPNIGWNGNVHGKPAAEGTYYYVITATGTDFDNKGKPKKYYEHGAVNLFRGKEQ